MPASLDIEQPIALLAYLRASGRIGPTEQAAVRILRGGVSNRTVLLQRPGGDDWVLKQALAQLRVAVDWFSDPQRIEREALALRTLTRLVPAGSVPRLVFEDRDQRLLAMQAVPEPHENWKRLLLGGMLQLAHVDQAARLLGLIHRHAWRQRDALRPLFADRRFFESLRLEPYYAYTATQLPAAAAFLSALIDSTRDRCLTLVHGDYSPKNMLIQHDRLILLDHEVAHWGDPAFDVGFLLTHLLSKAHHLMSRRSDFAAAARRFWLVYQQVLGPTVTWSTALESHAVRHTLGCLLARVAGRSPLEYLDAAEQGHLQRAVLGLLETVPGRVDELITNLLARLETHD